MSAASDLLSQYVSNGMSFLEQKKSEVSSVAANKKGYLGGAEIDVGINPEITTDSLLNPGSDLDIVSKAAGRSQYVQDASTVRTQPAAVGDSIVDIVNGALQGAIGIGSMGAGIINDKAATTIAGWGDSVGNTARDLQSDALNGRRRALEARHQATDERNRLLEQQDRANGDGEFVAGLKRFGRDFIDSATNQDGVTFGSGVSNGIGSFVLGAGLGKLLQATGATAKMAMGTSIGLQEGGGVHAQTVNEVMAMSHDELLQTSDDYARLIAGGMHPEDARTRVANSAGLLASIIQAPVGAATGALLSKWELNPTKVGSVRAALANIGKEGVEEAIQSGSGEAAGNQGIQTFVDARQELLDGVARASGEGALFGLGTAGVMQGPGAAREGAVKTAKTVGRGAKAFGSAVMGVAADRVNSIRAKLSEADPLSAQNLDATATEISQTAPADVAAMNDVLELTDVAPEVKEAVRTKTDELLRNIQIDPAEVENLRNAGFDTLAEITAGSQNRFQQLQAIAALVNDEDSTPQEKLAAGLLLNRMKEQVGTLHADLAESLAELGETDNELKKRIQGYSQTLNDFIQQEEVGKALQTAIALDAKEIGFEQALENLTSSQPEERAQALQSAQLAIEHVQQVPEQADLAVNRKLMFHAEKGDIELTPEQQKALEASTAFLEAKEEHEQNSVTKSGRTAFGVSNDIQLVGMNGQAPSIQTYLNRITRAFRQKNPEAAKRTLEEFMLFAQHMNNKVDALNRALASGNSSAKNQTTYQSLTWDRQWVDSMESYGPNAGVWVNPNAPKSVRNAQQIAADARAVVRVANGMAKIHSDLGVQPIAEVTLDPSLEGDIIEVAQEYRKGRRKPGQVPGTNEAPTPVRAEPKTEAKPELKSEPKAELKAEPKSRKELRQERFKAVQAKLATAQPGEMMSVRTYPGELADPIEEGLHNFVYVTKNGVRVSGSYSLVDQNGVPAIENFNIGDTSNKVEIGAGHVLAIGRKLLAKHPKIQLFHGYRMTGARSEQEHLYYRVENGKFSVIDEATYENGGVNPADASTEQAETEEVVEQPSEEAGTETVSSGEPNTQVGQNSDDTGTGDEQPKPVAPAEPVNEPEPVTGLRGAVPGLIENKEGGIINRFLSTFKLPEVARSRLFELGDAWGRIKDGITSSKKLIALIGEGKISGKMNSDISRAYQGLMAQMDAVRETMDERLQAKLDQVEKTHTGKTFRELLLNGDPKLEEARNSNTGALLGQVNTWSQLKALNLVEEQDGQLRYNDSLVQAGMMAAVQWLALSGQKGRRLKHKDVADILRIDENEVPDHVVDAFNDGFYQDDVILTIAQTIKRFWGVTAGQSAPEGYAQGIAEALAAEILGSMLQHQIIGQTETPHPHNGRKIVRDGKEMTFRKVYTHFVLNPNESFQEVLKTARQMPELFSEIIEIEPVRDTFIGTPPSDEQVPDTQMNGSWVPLAPQQKEMVRNANNIPYHTDLTFIEMVTHLGPEVLVDWFGGGKVDETTANVNHAKSMASKNKTVITAIQTMAELYGRLANIADAEGKNVSDIPVYFAHAVSSVGRLQQLGKDTPQSNKLIREMLAPTLSTLDLSDQTGKEYRAFMLAVAQHLGIKIQKAKIDTTLQQVQSLLDDDFGAVIQTLQAWESSRKPMTPAQLKLIKDVFTASGYDLTPASFRSLVEYARFQNADEAGKKAFTTSVYLEADGVTDGPINALVNLATGYFTPNWLRMVAKGGLLFGGTPMSINDYISQGGENSVDLYEHTTNSLTKIMKNVWDLMAENPGDLLRNFDDLTLILGTFFGKDVIYNPENPGEITFKRGMAKNPLTVSIYGSGATGIANKLMDAIRREYYRRLSEGPAFSEAEKKALNRLFNTRIEKRKKQLQFSENRTSGPDHVGTIRETLTSQMTDNLRDNLLHLFVQPLRDAIDTTIGSTNAATDAILRATQAQSVYLENQFKAEVEKALDAKEGTPGWKRSDFLTKKELGAVLQKILRTSPMITNGTQNFLPATVVDSEAGSTHFAASLDGKLRVGSHVKGPGNSGVSGIPMLVIGTGDGHMIQIVATMPGRPEGVLFVFDGINMKLSSIEEDSQKINQAVWQGWQRNPLARTAKSFNDFLKNLQKNNYEDLSDEMVKQLAHALEPEYIAKTMSPQDVIEGLEFLGQHITELGQEADARHWAMSQVSLSVDHMAGAEAPHFHKGSVEIGTTMEEQLATLNRLYKQRLSEIRKIQQGSAQPRKLEYVEKLGHLDASGAKVMSIKQLQRYVSRLQSSPEQAEMLRETIKALRDSGYEVVIGSLDQIEAYAKATGKQALSSNDVAGRKVHGFISPADRTVYLVDATAETLLHELVHAATIDKVARYYADPKSVTKEEAEAVKRIEVLANQFLNEEIPASAPLAQRLAMQNAQREVRFHLNNGNKPEALNEFMAWNLANQALVEKGKATQAHPVVQMIKDVLAALKQLVFGSRRVALPKGDVFSNLRFNTQILLASAPSLQEEMRRTIMFHASQPDNSARATAILQSVENRLANYLNSFPVAPIDGSETRNEAELRLKEMLAQSSKQQAIFHHAGFSMNLEEKLAFSVMNQILMTEMELDPNALAQVQKLFAHAMGQITPDSFIEDPKNPLPGEKLLAQAKFNALTGLAGLAKDERNRTSLLPSFLALATVNSEFQDVLAKIELPQSLKDESGTLDAQLTNRANQAMDNLASWTSGQGKNARTVKDAMDRLSNRIFLDVAEHRNIIENYGQTVQETLNKADNIIADKLREITGKGYETLTQMAEGTDNQFAKAALGVVSQITGLLNEDKAEVISRGWMSQLNASKAPKFLFDVMNQVVGRTSENAAVFDMIKKVRAYVQQTRQQFREFLPKKIESKFSRKLTKQEWASLTQGLARTDIAALLREFSRSDVIEMLDNPSRVRREIVALEAKVRQYDPQRANLLLRKSRELAHWMNTGEQQSSGYLLRNSVAITKLLGEVPLKKRGNYDPNLEPAIDQLVTLYAFRDLDQGTKDVLASLVRDEKDGIDFVLAQLKGRWTDEQAKVGHDTIAAHNHIKGYFPTENKPGGSLIVADDIRATELREMGYERVGTYEGSDAEIRTQRLGYYYAPVSAKPMFNQGIMQNIRASAGGVDPTWGLSMGLTAGVVFDEDAVRAIRQNKHSNQGQEALQPIFGLDGSIQAFERMISREQQALLQQEDQLHELLGIWAGRQAEEHHSQGINDELIAKLADIYDKEDLSRKNSEYVNLFDPATLKKDAVYRDAVNLITPTVRQRIESYFGKGEFWVRKDMLNDVLGYRAASISDAWTGNTRWNPEVQKAVKNVAMGVFGADAYKRLVQAEKFYQNFITDARVTIVVKSVIVPVANLMSNVYYLTSRGVPIQNIVRGMRDKTVEIDAFMKGRLRRIELEAELQALDPKSNKAHELKAEIRSILDANRRLSIWPLIEAGELSSITDVGLSQEDIMLAEGRLSEYMEKLTDKLPDSLKTAGRYGLISRDTALFQGLQKAVAYGDFLAKAVLYDDLTKRQKKDKAYALGRVSEEFINYDRLPGRDQTYLENMGLIWFWNFKLRAIKIAAATVRNNPLHLLLTSVLPLPGESMGMSIGTPVTDNMLSVAMDGRLGYSVGIDQGLRAHALNPWWNLLN